MYFGFRGSKIAKCHVGHSSLIAPTVSKPQMLGPLRLLFFPPSISPSEPVMPSEKASRCYWLIIKLEAFPDSAIGSDINLFLFALVEESVLVYFLKRNVRYIIYLIICILKYLQTMMAWERIREKWKKKRCGLETVHSSVRKKMKTGDGKIILSPYEDEQKEALAEVYFLHRVHARNATRRWRPKPPMLPKNSWLSVSPSLPRSSSIPISYLPNLTINSTQLVIVVYICIRPTFSSRIWVQLVFLRYFFVIFMDAFEVRTKLWALHA